MPKNKRVYFSFPTSQIKPKIPPAFIYGGSGNILLLPLISNKQINIILRN